MTAEASSFAVQMSMDFKMYRDDEKITVSR